MKVVATCLAALVILAPGCTQPPVQVLLDPPVIQPEPQVTEDTTLMDRFQELSRLYDSERMKTQALERSLAEETAARESAEAELAAMREKVKALEAKAAAYEDIKTKYDDAQQKLLELTDTVRELRRNLYEEKLARVRNEQTIVSLQIARAKEQRRRVVSGQIQAGQALGGTSEANDETAPENP